MHAPSTRCSCGSQSLRRGGWPCSSRIAFRRCGWRTGSWCSRAASWWTRGRTRSWWPGAGCTPSCSASRRRAIGDPDEHVTQVAVATPRRARRLAAEIAFVVQAARPGFWLTSIWFYLVPVGGRNVLAHGEFWLGLFYVSFPLGVLLYGWNDVVDFEADRFNPRKGNVPVRRARHAGTTRAPAVGDRVGASAVCDPVHAVTRTQGARVVRGGDRRHRDVQLSAVRVQRTSRFRPTEPSRVPARLRPRQLAEPCLTGALVHLPVRCHVCDALPSVRPNHGFGTRSERRPSDARRRPTCRAGEVARGRVSRC